MNDVLGHRIHQSFLNSASSIQIGLNLILQCSLIETRDVVIEALFVEGQKQTERGPTYRHVFQPVESIHQWSYDGYIHPGIS